MANEENIKSITCYASSLIGKGEYGKAYDLLKEARKRPDYSRDLKILDLINTCGLKGIRKGLNSFWCIRKFEGHTTEVNSVAITPDDRYAISGSSDTRLWDIEKGECLRVFVNGHVDSVHSVAITPDGRYVISGGDNIKLWDIEKGGRPRVFGGHTDVVSSIAITSDGRYVISGSWDNTLRLWELDWDWEFPDERASNHIKEKELQPKPAKTKPIEAASKPAISPSSAPPSILSHIKTFFKRSK